jgi:hypothetical protein
MGGGGGFDQTILQELLVCRGPKQRWWMPSLLRDSSLLRTAGGEVNLFRGRYRADGGLGTLPGAPGVHRG